MTQPSSIRLNAFLILIISSLFTGTAVAVPAIWEAQLGATITDAALDPTLDNADDVDTGADLTFGTMAFPFAGTTYTGTDTLNIASNGFISLGGSNGSNPDATALLLTTDTFPLIAPFWTNLDLAEGGDVFINRFNDDADAAIDRIVITYAGGHHECSDEDCSVLVQVQLLEDGTIIFAYNGIDMVNPGDTNSSDLLIGISPADGAIDPGSTDISSILPTFDSGSETTIYELFLAASAPLFDLDGKNLIFTPNLTSGFAVSDSMLNPPESTGPDIWETRIGTTLDGSALDNADDATVNLSFDTMMFPFAGTTYTGADILNISSNGFISLGGDNGADGGSGDPTKLTGDVFPRIAPFWTDLDPGAEGGDIFINRITDDDGDAAIDRIVITYAVGHFECSADECSVLVQVQLKENGEIIFGYNGIDLTNAANDVSFDVLVGLSPGIGSNDLGSADYTATAPFNSATGDAIYELFVAASAPPVDLDGGNIVFTPDGGGGFDITAPGISGSALGGVAGRNSNKGHCSLAGEGAAFDPTLWLLVLISFIYLGYRRPCKS